MKVKLVVVQGKPAGLEILLHDAKFLIGRGPECHLRPNSELVSRHHCMFIIEGCQVTLRDLGSTNGTLVNGERVVGAMSVLHEDLIQVGPIGFRIMLDPVPVSSPAECVPVRVAADSRLVPSGPGCPGQGMTSGTPQPVVEQWLDGDPDRITPVTGSEGSECDSDLLNTTVETEDRHDTQHELPTSLPADAPGAATSQAAALDGGRTVTVGDGDASIEKTYENAGRAAADALRPMMDRRGSGNP